MNNKGVVNGVRARLLQLAASPDGVSTYELAKGGLWALDTICQAASKLGRKGLAHVVGERHLRRVFVDAKAAQRYAAELEAYQKDQRAKWRAASAANMKRRREAARAAAPAPSTRPGLTRKKEARGAGVTVKHYGRAPWPADAPAIEPAGLRKTTCPSPPAFGPAARLQRVSAKQEANMLPPLKVGQEA